MMKIELENIFFLKKELNIIKYKSVPIIPIDAKNPNHPKSPVVFSCSSDSIERYLA